MKGFTMRGETVANGYRCDYCGADTHNPESHREKCLGQKDAEIERLKKEIERLRGLLGRDDPVRCAVCGHIRERAEVICGQCSYRLDGSDVEGEE